MSSAHPWTSVRNLLAIRTDDIGDVLMTTPALRAITESLPDAQITLLASPAGAAAGRLLPEVHDVISWTAPWATATPGAPLGVVQQAEALRQRSFDAAIVFTKYDQSAAPGAMLAYLAGIPRRLAHSREHLQGLLTQWVRDPEPTERIRHEVDRQLALVGSIGLRTSNTRLSLNVPSDARMSLRRRFTEHDIDISRPWIAVHPGTPEDARHYPIDRLVNVIRQIRAVTGCRVILVGAPEDAGSSAQLAEECGPGVISMAGALRFEELVALIAHAPLLISNNDYPAHIAAAVGTRTVVLYARTHPQLVPWGVPSRVLYFDFPPCDECTHDLCRSTSGRFRTVEPQIVAKAALDLLGVVPWQPPAQLEALAY